MDEISFVVKPELIALGTLLVPFLVELFTRIDASTKVKQHVATGVVILVLLGSAAIDYFVDHEFRLDSASDVYRIAWLLFAQFGVVRAAVEGGHRLYDAAETKDRKLGNVLAPNFGVGAGTRDEELARAA
ncbi:MAG: hypothetical protein OEW29_16245 [Acidimicrobiia bacterium]|nr:hypothetical protein [Acidimicrobiia bacterium]MDH4365429.1 hypothetical protein [Acidimicrobiia bacterium]